MDNETEVSLLPESGTDEVSLAAPVMTSCETCTAPFQKKGNNSRFCDACKPGRKAVAVAKRTDKKKASSFIFNSGTLPTKPEGKELLRARGLKSEHIVDLAYDMTLSVAEQVEIPPNRFMFANGVVKALASYALKAPQTLEVVEPTAVIGELSNLAELVCLHDLSIAWREDAVDFPEFMRLRRLCKTDAYELGLLLGKDWEECQKNWFDFLPKFNPDTLSPTYTQKEMRLWLDSISPVKDYLLLASRNSMKSSAVVTWLLTAHLCAPDARAILVSETQKLSSGFIRAYRNYWEVQPRSETMLQKLFPEYCIRVGEGSEMNFRSPMAHLNLIQPSASKSSAETAETGGRAEIIIEDDIISNLTVGTEEQIQKSINIHSLLQKLREVLGSFTVVVGTPWASTDLYAHLLEQAEKNKDEQTLASRIDPIVTVKSSARRKLTPALLSTLTEEDVESYLLPVRMPWRFIKKEIAANPTFALSQNFCVFPLEQDSELRCQFEHDELVRATKHKEFFGHPITPTYASLDRAFSLSKYADLSCIVVGRVQPIENKSVLVVIESKMDRWKESELVRNIVDMVQKHNVTVLVGQQDKGWAELSEAIRRQCAMRGIPTPWLRFQPIDNTANAKARRVKKLELPISDSRLFFVSSTWTEAALLQLEKFDGVTKSSTRKDDFPDALSILWDSFGPKYSEEIPAEDLEQRRRDEEEEARRTRKAAQYQAMFGAEVFVPTPTPTESEQPAAPQDPRLRIFGGNGKVWRV